MNPQIEQRLQRLRDEFATMANKPFDYFFCPFLFVDENAELCKAHVVNDALPDSSKRWTVQRKDVDNFFGAMFESALVDLQLDEEGIAAKALVDPDLYRRLQPKVLLDGAEVGHFVADGQVPSKFAVLHFEHDNRNVILGIKASSEQLATVTQESDWEFEVSRDLRVPAVVSVLKAAHLTMFELMGYSYALRSGGEWLGQVLGAFYRENVGKSKPIVMQKAAEYFAPLAAMVRPVREAPPAFTGSVDDQRVHFCWSDDIGDRTPWGIVTYVRTGKILNAVVLPVLEHEAGAERFARFLGSNGDLFEISAARFEGESWSLDTRRRTARWPPAAFGD